MTFILTTNKNGETFFWTGRAGNDNQWISTDRSEAFAVTFDEAHRKASSFNEFSPLHSMTFEVESVFQVGDRIRSFDFQPREDIGDRFVEGLIERISNDGRLVIRVDFDSTEMNRVGTETKTPFWMPITEWAGRLSFAGARS